MEEISHCFLGHKPTKVLVKGLAEVRDFDKRIEEEAYGVGAAVLLPWRSFFPLLDQGASQDELAEEFDVTPQLVLYRIKICGASRLFSARTRASSFSAKLSQNMKGASR